jgi:hypothetical protein
MLYRLSTLSLCVHLNGFKQVARKHGQIIEVNILLKFNLQIYIVFFSFYLVKKWDLIIMVI